MKLTEKNAHALATIIVMGIVHFRLIWENWQENKEISINSTVPVLLEIDKIITSIEE